MELLGAHYEVVNMKVLRVYREHSGWLVTVWVHAEGSGGAGVLFTHMATALDFVIMLLSLVTRADVHNSQGP